MKKDIIKKAEIRERDVVSFNLQNLGITEVIFSEIGSFSPWDLKYKRDGDWFACNVKVFQHTSDKPYDFMKWNSSWKTNPIEGHPVKRTVLERLMTISMTETFQDSQTIKIDDSNSFEDTFTNYYRPSMLYLFSDGVALEWMIDELPISWDPVNVGFKSKHFVGAWNPKTQEDWTPVLQQFYGLKPELANRYEWKEPTRQLKSWRNEDCPSFTKKQEYLQSLTDPKMK
jgi:hypothetical protein